MSGVGEPRGRKPLSPRQAEVVGLVAAGLGDKEIAGRLGISIHTVRTHLERVFREQHVRNRAAAAARALTDEAPAAAKRARGWHLDAAWALLLVLAVFVSGALAGTLVMAVSAGGGAGLRSQAPRGLVAAESSRRQGLPAAPSTGKAAAPTPRSLAPPAAHPAAGQSTAPSAAGGDMALAEATQINSVRTANGLAPLAWQGCLASVAAQNANRVAAQGYLSPAGGSLAAERCDPGAKADEILVYWSSADPQAVTEMLLADPLRRSELLGTHRAVGIAWAAHGVVSYLAIELA